MQSSSPQPTAETSATQSHGRPAAQPEGTVALPVDDSGRPMEEFRMLLFGFGTGITIAVIFLIYIVLAYSNVLP